MRDTTIVAVVSLILAAACAMYQQVGPPSLFETTRFCERTVIEQDGSYIQQVGGLECVTQ